MSYNPKNTSDPNLCQINDNRQEENFIQNNFLIDAPNYTTIPNCILDNLHLFSGSETLVLMVICRYTFGWHKERFALSRSELSKLTGIKKESVIKNALDKFKKLGLIKKIGKTKNGTNAYSLVVNNSQKEGTKSTQRGYQKYPPSVKEKERTKEKENIYINKTLKKTRTRDATKKVLKEKPKKIKYSENIEMTERDYNKLVEKFGDKEVKSKLEEYDRWKYNNAVGKIDDYRGMLNWIKKENLKKSRKDESIKKIVQHNINWLKNHIEYLTRIGARADLRYNQIEAFDLVLNKTIPLSAKNMIDIVKSWDRFRR